MFDKLIQGNHWNEGTIMQHVIFPPAGLDRPIVGSQEDCFDQTAEMLAGYSHKYAVTKDEKDRDIANQLFEGILKLEKVIPLLDGIQIGSNYEKGLIEFDYSLAYNAIGRYWMDKKNPDQAIVYYRKAIDVNPEYAETYNNIASIYFARRAYGLARYFISKALELEPSNGIYLKNLRIIMETKIQVE